MPLDVSTELTAAAALIAVLGLIWLIVRGVRMAGLASPRVGAGRTIAIEEIVALDARRRLYLIRCSDRQVLLLTGGERDSVVGWVPQPDFLGNVGRSQ